MIHSQRDILFTLLDQVLTTDAVTFIPQAWQSIMNGLLAFKYVLNMFNYFQRLNLIYIYIGPCSQGLFGMTTTAIWLMSQELKPPGFMACPLSQSSRTRKANVEGAGCSWTMAGVNNMGLSKNRVPPKGVVYHHFPYKKCNNFGIYSISYSISQFQTHPNIILTRHIPEIPSKYAKHHGPMFNHTTLDIFFHTWNDPPSRASYS